MPYGKIIATTPSNLDLPEGIACKNMIDNAATFDEAMYDWNNDKIKKYLDTNSTNDFIHIQFSWKQLGRTEEWYKQQCRALNNDLLKIKREIDIKWTLAAGTSPFAEEQLEEIDKHIKDPVGTVFLNNVYKFNIFEDNMDTEKPWLIGVDVAGGLARDDTAITVANPVTYEVVATFRNNTIDSVELEKLLCMVIRLWLPNAVLIIERNSYGLTVLDHLIKTPDIVDRIYWELREVQAEQKTMNGKVVHSKVKTKIYGVNTSPSSREKMINDILRFIVDSEPEKIIAESIYADIRNLATKKTGKIEHREGAKDDGLFSYLILRYVVGFGTNLARFNVGLGSGGRTIAEAKKSLNNNIALLSQQNKKQGTNNFALTTSILQENLSKSVNNKPPEENSTKSSFLSIMRMNLGNNNDSFKK